MCGGLKPANSDWTIDLDTAIYSHTGHHFGGFLRKESFDRTWSKRVVANHWIPVEGFIEKGYKFIRPGKMSVVDVQDPYHGDIRSRIVTEPADADVMRVHPRQPVIRKDR